ncbi:MAG: hypothetical protein RBQ97_01995 [Acholeplasma sp.]|nr:hypothetical protein [Acholeplasma sp.]
MKKFLLGVLMMFSSLFLLGTVNAAETVTGKIVIHFQKWNGDYSDVGINTWSFPQGDPLSTQQGPTALGDKTKTDSFGVYWESGDITTTGEGSLGFQVVGFDNVGESNESANFDKKKYTNHQIDAGIIKDGKTVHVYMFQGSNNRTDNEKDPNGVVNYIVADPDKQGIMVVYYDSTGNYEEKLGVHSWGWAEGGNASRWNEPLKLFTDAGKSVAGVRVKAGVLYYADPVGTPGAIVYYGDGDNSKKTNNLEPMNKDNAAYVETPTAKGQLDIVYTVNAGNGNVSNENVWLNDAQKWSEKAFKFELVAFKAGVDGKDATGTYAANPTTVMVSTNQELTNIYVAAKTDEERETADATIKSWFTVKEITSAEGATTETYGDAINIKNVDYAKGTTNTTLKDFVLTLGSPLDNSKRYKVFFDDKGEGEAAKKHELELDLDREKPVITFLGTIAGKVEAERIIVVPWNKKFDQNLFPTYLISDDRDGDLKSYAYVPKGDFSTLNTNEEGDYVIMLQVEDSWGNVTQEKFTFRVTKDTK